MNTQRPLNGLSNVSKRVTNVTRQGINRYQSATVFGKVIFIIILILFIALIIYLISYAIKANEFDNTNSPVLINDVIDAFVARPALPLPQITQGMNHSISTWIYIKDWNYNFGKYKNILWIGNPTSTTTTVRHSPSIWLYPLTNSLKVITSTSSGDNGGVESCDIQNIPLMSWVNIVYVLNNRTVDIYINGMLERSCALKGIPVLANDSIYFTSNNTGTVDTANSKSNPGFYGKLGKTIYYTKALLPNDVANLYQQGPLGSSYQVQFFTDGNLISINNNPTFSS